MSEVISLFESGTQEYSQLEKAAEMLTEKSLNGYRYYVGDTYFDLGQGWIWTTILCDSGCRWGDYQAITPTEQEDIIFSKDLNKTTDKILADSSTPM